MPTITIDRKEFDKLMGKRYPDELLKDRISMLGTDLEKLDSREIMVEIFPNRPDMLSAQGFVRALKTFMGIEKGLKEYVVKNPPIDFKVMIEKSVHMVRPYTACAIVRGLKFDDQKIKEVIQIQEKLHTTFGRNREKVAIGIYPFEKITLPIRFVGSKPEDVRFVPLEWEREMNGLQILSQHPAGRDYAHLLEGKSVFPFFIDAANEVLSMPPIINSERTGKIIEKTKDVFIECSGFDMNTLNICLNMIVTALADMGGTIYAMKLEYPDEKTTTPDLRPKRMKVDLNYINKWLGLDLKMKDFKRLFEKMGYSFDGKEVKIPPYRSDIMHPVDLAEDIAIAYGYENFDAEIPNVSTIGEEDPFEVFKKKIADLMIGLGFLETVTYHLTNRGDMNKNMLTEMDCIELMNPANIEYDILRSWMIPSIMKVLSENTRHDYPQKIFDIGSVFKKNPKRETGVEEFVRIACVSCHKDANYTEIRQYLDYLLSSLGLEHKIVKTEHPSFIPGRAGRVSVNGKKIAYIGEIHPKVLDNFGIEQPVCAFEVNLSDMLEILKK
ncbi:MAG: phenylalanine--tRNA ligase subunit beta [Candidatus Aenigmarchaeota archaeon]|nr:phenylalanine--tRNA ligase subunit beta [Candidatus Aenigmarchaeota archaeon]